ncbi:MAG: helix-turn-helix domain-containing protein [Oscillospiraceae bacterium]|nr:helix-turn-helix domain-containing protein [Oscillospiraceae bacterium]
MIGNAFSELDKVAIAQIRNALSISTLSQISISQQQEKLRTDFIHDLLTGHTSEEDILRRSAAIQCDISRVEGCIVLDICDFKQLLKHYSEDEIVSLKTEFYELVQNELHALGNDSICCGLSDKVVILHIRTQTRQQAIAQTARFLQRTLKSSKNIEVAAGIGCRCRSFRDIRQSYETARLALRIATSDLSPSTCVDSEEFPAYMLLLQAYQAEPEAVRQVVARLLEPVRKYDQARNSALEETFRALLRCDMNYNRVAEQLFLHKNTVLQRKQKIASLYREDPFQLPYRRQFEFAFILESFYDKKGIPNPGSK